MRRAIQIALGALVGAAALAAGYAQAQFRTTPMVLPGPSPDEASAVLAQPFGSPGTQDADLLVLYAVSGSSTLRPHHRLASSSAPPALLPQFSWARAGRLAPLAWDALPDVAYCSLSELWIAFGHAPGALAGPYLAPLNARQAPTLTFARLVPRDAQFIVMPHMTGVSGDPTGVIAALEMDPATAAMSLASWTVPARTHRLAPDEVLPMRIGANARALGIDDLYMLGSGSVTIFENRSSADARALAQIDLASGIRIGGSGADVGIPDWHPPWLPAGVPNADAQGAAPLDVDGDGTLDLVVTLSSHIRYADHRPGHLLWIKGTGTLADFSAAGSWGDLNGDPDLLLSDPVVARPLAIGGEPAVALWDRGLDEIVVIRSGAGGERFRVWRGAAGGRGVIDIFLADLVGSSAPDLVANATGSVDAGDPPSSPSILVYPDVGDASPQVAWAAGSPGTASRGEDHPMQVDASDADGTFRIDWFLGDPWVVPAAASGPALTSYELPGSILCATPPQQQSVTVRAVDDLGVWDEIAGTVDVAETPPRIAIAGATPSDRLVLPPGGAEAVFEGSAWSRCPVALAWGTGVWPAAAGVTTEAAAAGVTRQTVVLPEAAYPEILAAAGPVVSLTATDPALAAPWTVTMPVAIDATGLVEIEHVSDLPAIAEGEIAVLRTRLRSRIGVALEGVRVVDALEGLAPAGPPRAIGASIAESRAGGAEVVLDALPPAGAEVVIDLPVRSAGARHASAVEAHSAGDHLLTPPAAAPAAAAPLPGCGCGSSPPGAAALAPLLLALRPARRRARRVT